MAEIIKRKTRMYEPWGYQEENNYESSENQFEIELNGLFASAKYDDTDKKIHFFNNDGDEISGSSIDTTEFASGVIEDAYYDSTTKELVIVFDNGTEVRINMAEIVDENEFSDGLQVDSGGVVSVKIDESGETYLSVSEDGIKISGVDDAIQVEADRATAAEEALDAKIEAETARAESAETELQAAIEAEEQRAISAETALGERIDEIASGSSELLDALIEKLGYTDNDTIERNNGGSEVAFGTYNISTQSDDPAQKTLFSIGNGTDDANRNNALEVKQNGDLYLWVEGEFMNVNRLLAQIAHEVYDSDAAANNPHYFDGD